MARTFAFLTQGNLKISDESIFEDVSSTIESALKHCHARSQAPTRVASTAFAIALDQFLCTPVRPPASAPGTRLADGLDDGWFDPPRFSTTRR
ncbi:hypothetical protein [Streptomyces sp. HUAS ZL42]|uniref:hypothetical protein n=1 Tax=Streptomyces sp. HUAS ZL42 TaxID=3231715 RepID=UPI00345EF7BD